MTSRELLEEAGSQIISFVRDDALAQLDQLLAGTLRPAEYRSLSGRLASLSSGDLATLREVAVRMVDTTIHDFLWLLEGEAALELARRLSNGSLVSLSQQSDGLAAELYSDNGWICKYSRYPTFTVP